MTQSSPFGGRRDFDLALFGEDDSINTVLCRDYVSNNVQHAADQACARVLVNTMAADDTYIVDNVDQFTTGYYRDDQWLCIGAYGPFDVSCRMYTDGIVVPYRLRAAVNASSGTSLSEVHFAVEVVRGEFFDETIPGGYLLATAPSTDGTNFIRLGSTTSATPAWLTPVGNGWCNVTMDNVSHVSQSTLDVPGGTVRVSTNMRTIGLRLLAYGDAVPKVWGFHVAEYFG